jgi:D-alanyl-D-alanine carboxypeptidase (penicillin-binding protein 5/6)
LLKYTKIILVSILLILYTMNGALAASPQINGKAAVLMDANSGRVLWGSNIHEKLPMASTTKIMTALVALEYGDLQDRVVISPSASGIEGSSIWLSPGEEHSLEDLLFGLMLRSGNDAAVAIAEHISGSIEAFAELMNQKAREIGAENTNFTNPHGLPDDNHYTTAYDLALIASYSLQNQDFERIVSTKYKTIPWPGHEWDRAMKNKNKLLWDYEGATGVKTGYTQKAGRCLVSSAKRDGMYMTAVVLNCGLMFEECVSLMEFGFNNYKNHTIYIPGELLSIEQVNGGMENKAALVVKEGFSIALNEEEAELLNMEIYTDSPLTAPIYKDQVYGKVQIFIGDELIREIPLVAEQNVERRTFYRFFRKILQKWILY